MPARSKARKRALDILYESDLRGLDVMQTLAERVAASDPPVPEYAVVLIEGVTARRERIDDLLASYSIGWTLERMPTVDRNILRLGTYELLWAADVPDPVAVVEPGELGMILNKNDSPGFVNGLLARLLELKPTLTV